MSSTTKPPTAHRFTVADTEHAGTPPDQPSPIPKHAEPPGFSCAPSPERPGVTRIMITGELDIATSPRLKAALSRPPDRTPLVILDLSALTFIDATGLDVILNAHSQLQQADRRLVIIPGPRAVQRLFEITATEHQLDFRNTSNGNHLVA